MCGPGRAGNAPTSTRSPEGKPHAPATADATEDFFEARLDIDDDDCYDCEVLDDDHFTLQELSRAEMPTSSTDAPKFSAAPPEAKRARFNFDDSDEEPFESRIGQDDGLSEVPIEIPEAFSLRPKRRLVKKTSQIDTAFSNTALANRKDFKVRMVEQKIEKRRFKSEQTMARAEAIQILANQPPTVDHREIAEVYPPIEADERPHASHEILTLQNNEDIIFCRVCSAWSARLKLKSLLVPCQELKDGNRSRLKLLMAGVAPYPGAKMPTTHSRAQTGRRSYLRK